MSAATSAHAVARLGVRVCCINDLPAELLIRIFGEVIIDDQDHRCDPLVLQLATVCRYWYQTTRHSSLWTRIHLEMGVTGVEIFLQNSGDQLISLLASTQDDENVGLPSDSIMSRHMHRLKVLDIIAESSIVTSIVALLAEAKPKELLSLKLNMISKRASLLRGNIPVTQNMPKLRSLYLRNISVSTLFSCGPRDMTSVILLNVPVTLEHFKTICVMLSAVRQLSLSTFIHEKVETYAQWMVAVSTGTPLELPFLKKLRLTTRSIPSIRALLSNFLIPTGCDVGISFVKEATEATSVTGIIPESSTFLGKPDEVASIRLWNNVKAQSKGFTFFYGLKRLRIPVQHAFRLHRVHDSPAQSLVLHIRSFPTGSFHALTSLSITADPENESSHEGALSWWEELFISLWTIQHLSFDFSWRLTMFCSPWIAFTVLSSATEDPGHPPFPNLRRLQINNLGKLFASEVEELCKLLSGRAGKGAVPLSVLDISAVVVGGATGTGVTTFYQDRALHDLLEKLEFLVGEVNVKLAKGRYRQWPK